MPVGRAAGLRRFVLDLVVPDAQFAGAGKLSDGGGDVVAADQPVEWLTGLPDVDDLPDGAAVVAAHVAHVYRLGDVAALAVVDDAHHFSAQGFYFVVGQYPPAVEKPVFVKLFDLRCSKHVALLKSGGPTNLSGGRS